MGLDFKEDDEDLFPFRRRLIYTFTIILFFFIVLLGRLAWLQIINQTAYVERAEKNRTVTITSSGSRGMIFDRNGEILATNSLEYSLEITPEKVQDINQTIDDLSKIIDISKGDRRRFQRLREDLNRYDSIPIRQKLSDQEVAVFIG